MRSLTLVTAPEANPVTLAEAKAHLRVDASDEDDLITSLIAAATAYLDGRDGILGRCLAQQTWDLKLDAFPAYGKAIAIPLPPLRSIDSITYVDDDGVTQTLAASEYQVILGGDWPGRVVEAYSKSWPSTRDIPEAVTVRFTAGYEPDESSSPTDYAANIPQALKQAMLLMIGQWYEHRQMAAVGSTVNTLPLAADALLAPFRVSTFG